nr:MAG TPA: hypothetical protein [Caudoviricetes sp.]
MQANTAARTARAGTATASPDNLRATIIYTTYARARARTPAQVLYIIYYILYILLLYLLSYILSYTRTLFSLLLSFRSTSALPCIHSFIILIIIIYT